MTLKTMTYQILCVLIVSASMTAFMAGNPQLAQASSSGARAALRELDLSFSQMRQLRGIMQDYRQELEVILTPEQLDQIEALRDARSAASDLGADDLASSSPLDDLDLSGEQTEQLAVASEAVEQQLQDVLTPEQLEQLEDIDIMPY